MQQLHSDWKARRAQILIMVVIVLFLGWMGMQVDGRDHRPLVWGLRAELTGGSAYGSAVATRIRANYVGDCETCAEAGFGYPLPAVWLALPIAPLPDPLARAVWCVLGLGSVLLGCMLLRMSPIWLLFAPLMIGAKFQQVTVLLVGLLLLGIWAQRERRWWLLGVIVALTFAAKPQATLLIAGTLAVLALRAGAWKPVLFCGLLVAGLTFAVEPAWLREWLAAVAHFRSETPAISLLAWMPLALVLFWLRQHWSALALLQAGLFPIFYGYALAPLLIGYIDLRSRWLAWGAVACSWLIFGLAEVWPAGPNVGLCYVVTLVVGAALSDPGMFKRMRLWPGREYR